jgi:hypothetical protein
MLKRIYFCDVCREEIKNLSALFGLHFSNMHQFTLGGYGSTEGKHLCYSCAKQLRDHLNSPEITKELGAAAEASENAN